MIILPMARLTALRAPPHQKQKAPLVASHRPSRYHSANRLTVGFSQPSATPMDAMMHAIAKPVARMSAALARRLPTIPASVAFIFPSTLTRCLGL